MKKIGLFLTGWCRMLLCVGLAALPSASLGARGELLADQRLNLNLSFSSASLREVVSAFTEQTGVVFSYETSLGKRTLSDVHVVIQDAPLEEMLNTLFYDTGISWKIKDHVVALTAIPSSKKNVSTGSAPSPSANRKPVVTGRVVNEEGEPLVGVNVLVKGTTQGTSTDIDGSYSIDVADDDVLQFTYLGYGSAEWRVGTQTRIDVVLKEDKQMLDEVVVVGYGTVKRRDLVGAVDQVDSKVFSERSNPSISRSLQGAIPNLNISMRDGKPSRAATINIRGTGSIGSGGGALVLIDGVEGDLETVNPQDIASVSVLKDASSAAIYGARGAFGVILVTTKSAEEGETKVTYNGSFSLHARTVKPQLVTDGYEWTTGYINAWNGYYNGQNPLPSYINNIAPYSDSWYKELARRSTDPSLERVRINDKNQYEYFANTDWMDAFYKDFNYSHEHNISVSGGNQNADYYVSGRFYDQDGIYRVGDERYKQYNVRAKGNIRIRPWLRLNNNMDFTVVDYHQPMLYYSLQLPQRMIEHGGQPINPITNPDGTWTYAAVLNGYAGFAEGSSYQQDDKFTMKDKLGIEIDVVKDVLKISGDLSYLFARNKRERVTNMYTGYRGPDTPITVNESQGSTLENLRQDTNYLSSNIYGEYTPKLGDDHTLKLLAGWNLETKKYRGTTIKREGLTVPSKPSFGLMDGLTSDPVVSGYDWSYVGAFFRANYGYQGKYLAEFSCRYDGSSKFPENSKWGFFPSASIGWRLSEEKFMEWSRNWLDNFKIRLSAGSMGNGNIDPYKYIDYMTIKTSTVVIGDALGSYTTAPGAIPLSLTWETATTYDVGFDMDLFRNRLSIGFDWYRRYTTDMYTVGVSLPSVYGTDAPKGNNASLKTNGWELSVGWRDSFELGGKAFSYNVKAMVWDARTWVTEYINPTGALGDYYEGKELGEIWGYRVEGLFRDQEDIDSHAEQSFLQTLDKVTRPGQVKFADLNQDGKIDRGAYTTADPGDLTVIGNETPRYCYGINLGFNWNGIGISTFWQGVGKKDWYPRYDSGFFWGQYNRPFGYMLKQHTGDKVYREELDNWDTAYWPRYTTYQTHQSSVNRPLTIYNDRYMQVVSYIRLKNITVDYTFPDRICKKLHIKGLKVWVSGENLWTYSPMFEHCDNYDPEVINAGDSDFRTSEGDGYSYPMLRTVTLGVNLSF